MNHRVFIVHTFKNYTFLDNVKLATEASLTGRMRDGDDISRRESANRISVKVLAKLEAVENIRLWYRQTLIFADISI